MRNRLHILNLEDNENDAELNAAMLSARWPDCEFTRVDRREDFLAALGESFGGKLGAFTRAGPRSAFPLSLRYRTESAGPHVVVIGNAAQTLHPVAGQGLNLGLRDAWELAELLLNASRDDLRAPTLAARFARRRAADRRAGIVVTDSLVRLFSSDWPLVGPARGAGLLAFDLLPGARRFLARRMMFGARALP